ncbi:MAG: glycosyltransferase family 39 protein [Candidatus Sulfotelmatobacter sp.]
MREDRFHPAAVFAVIFFAIFLLHVPLLSLPYFWDEAGYYVPAARDILLTGSLIPHTTLSNAHPPLVLAWIALWWKCAGYAPLVTRTAMLMFAAFSLLGVFRVAERVANGQVAMASTLCVAVYPVFFAQSSLAQVDLAAAGLIFWGLVAYLDDRPVAMAIWFSLAALSKETAIIAPLGLAGWEVLRLRFSRGAVPKGSINSAALAARPTARPDMNPPADASSSSACENAGVPQASIQRTLVLLIPLVPLITWYGYHYAKTGYVFGNPEFFRYNVAATLSFPRFLLALALRLWQVFAYQHLWVLTLAMILAMWLPPLENNHSPRRRIAISVQMVFLVVIASYVIAMALIGGAVLARYMLPSVPLVIIAAVSTLWRRVPYWPIFVAVVVTAFVMAWFVNPPYGFSPEDNLAYRDYVKLHEDGEQFLEARYPMSRTLTAWPASDELSRPWLGYITRSVQVVRIEDFSLEQVLSAADFRANFDLALVFSTKYQPAHGILDQWKSWEVLKTRYFGFHRDLPPAAIAQMLGGRIVFEEERKGQWIAVIALESVENATVPGRDPIAGPELVEGAAVPTFSAASTGRNEF